MPSRDEAKNKHRCWSFYFANKPGVSTLKRNLLTVIDNGNAKVKLREISACRVDCVWPKRVTYQSAARLVTRAKEINASFEILGLPKPVTDEADISEGKAASAAFFLRLGCISRILRLHQPSLDSAMARPAVATKQF